MAGRADKDGHRRGHRWRVAAWGAAAGLLLLPLLAMRFTDEVRWSLGDFVFAGVLAGSVGLGCELALRRSGSAAYRAGSAVALAAAFLLVWINAAVGIIGSEDHPANAVFAGVLAVGLGGALLARFRPLGLATALCATAAAQALVAVAALVAGPTQVGQNWPADLLALTAFFATLWLLSAWLFRRAARDAGGGR